MEPGAQREQSQEPSALARFFFLKPTFGLLLLALLCLGGVVSYGTLVKESMPDLAIPMATIRTSWAGADPQTIEQEVTDPIEKEVRTLRGLKSVRSASFDSFSVISVEFVADADMADSMQRLRAKVSDAEANLPKEAEAPAIAQLASGDMPIVSFVLFGDVGSAAIGRAAEDLEDRLERIAGVREVEVGGLRKEVIRVQLDPERLLAMGISPLQVRDAIQQANVDMPWGEIESEEIGATIRLFGKFRDIEELRWLPVARLGGLRSRAIRLQEIAEVRRDLEIESTRAEFSWRGAPFAASVELSVKKAPGADVITLIRRLEDAVEEARGTPAWPHGLQTRVTQNHGKFIEAALADVSMNALQAMAAVFVILFLMLTWREGLVAGLAIPVTFLGAMIPLLLLGQTMNEMVIIGMVLALGLIVDVFILMMEGLHEGIFVERQTFDRAVVNAVRRFALPAAAGQATTILALAPLMAIGGVPGKFIRILPLTAIVCIVTAFVVALAIALPLSRFVLAGLDREKSAPTRADRITARLSGDLRRWSLATILVSRGRAAGCVATAGAVFVVALVLFSRVPVTMFDKADGLDLGLTIELPPSTTLESSQLVADRIGAILREKPYLQSVVKLVGKTTPIAGGFEAVLKPSVAPHFVGFSCVFVPREERADFAWIYADLLREELKAVLHEHYAGATLSLYVQDGTPMNTSPVAIRLVGSDMNRLREISKEVQGVLSTIPGAVDVRDNLGRVRPVVKLVPRREAIDFYGLSQSELATQIRFSMASDEIGKFVVGGGEDDLSIRLGLAWPSRNGAAGGPTSLPEMAFVRAFTPEHGSVPLLSLVDPHFGTAPVSITHEGGRRSLTVSAKTDGRAANDIVAELLPSLEAMSAQWPAHYGFTIGGEAQETQETFGSAGVMFVVAIILVFALLVLLFGSFLQSLIILATMPLALIGTCVGFFLLWQPFSFLAMVGIISLIGIVVNDAIVMVDTMNQHRARGVGVAESAAHGAADRLRPILSTSLTTIAGLVPMAITSPMYRPLCYAVIFGLISSTVMALVVVPSLYFLLTPRDPAP